MVPKSLEIILDNIYFRNNPSAPISSIKGFRNFDALIYKTSRKNSNFETFLFKITILVNKFRYISDFNPIVIGGCPRSGTTLLRALIGTHLDIACPQLECNILPISKNKLFLQNVFDFTSEEIDRLTKKYQDNVCFAENALKLYLQKEGTQFVALKNPFHIVIVEELFRYFPNMKFIHVIRDGRDTACSLRTFPKKKIVNGKIVPNIVSNPFDWCIRRWVSCVNHGRIGLNYPGYLEVKYEDLVNNTVITMEKIFEFLGVKMIDSDKILNFYKYEKKDKHLQQTLGVKKPLYKKSIGKWINEMNKFEKLMFKRMAGDLLIDLNYESNFDW